MAGDGAGAALKDRPISLPPIRISTSQRPRHRGRFTFRRVISQTSTQTPSAG